MFTRFDTEPICDECFGQRARWMEAKEATREARRAMLKLPLAASRPRQKDVA